MESAKIPVEAKREILLQVARTSLRTKVHHVLADLLTEACVDAVLAIKEEGTNNENISLWMCTYVALTI